MLEVGDVNQQNKNVNLGVGHKLLSVVRPNHWSQKDVMATFEFVGNVKVELHSLQESKNKNQLIAKHATFSMYVSTCATSISITRTICILELHHYNIVVAIGRHAFIDTSINPEWATKTKTQ